MIIHCAPWNRATCLETQPAEIIEEKRRTSDSACILPGVIHSNLIPWYTSGFE